MSGETIRLSRLAIGSSLLILVAAIFTNCNKPSPTVPTPPVPAPTPAPPTVTGVAISGKFALTTIAETSQLRATATLSDNTTKDVTSDGVWRSDDARVVDVSNTGLLRVVGYGATLVSFTHAMRTAFSPVTATPVGTFIISGRVREPGVGGLAGVAVHDRLSGRTVTTDVSGEFTLGDLPSVHAQFSVAINGYEPAELDATRPNVDLPVQKVVRLAAGETVTPHPLAPNDLSYTIGNDRCDDCRLIRVVATRSGSLRVHVTWTYTATRFRLFVQGQIANGGLGDLTADTQINAPGEVLMYLGVMPSTSASHTNFTFTTSWN